MARSRSAIRSAVSSSPIWKRATTPANFGGVAVAGDVAGGGQRQALEAAPGRADAEQRQAVDHRVDRLGGEARLELDAEQAGGAGEVPLPQLVAGRAGQRRVQHAGDFRPGGEPFRDDQAGIHLVVQPQPHRAGAA